MDKEKLFKQIEIMKKTEVEKYQLCIQNLINKYPKYYQSKKKKNNS